jgi:hypothetical protein
LAIESRLVIDPFALTLAVQRHWHDDVRLKSRPALHNNFCEPPREEFT